MKVFYTLLYILMAATVSLPAHGQWQLINCHKAWSERYYGEPAAFEEPDALRQASMIIAYGVVDEPAVRFLDTLADRIPEISDFTRMLRAGEVDPRFVKTLATLDAVAQYTENNYPDSNAAIECRYRFYNGAVGMQDDNIPAIQKFIKQQKKNLGKNPDRERRALLSNTKILAILAKAIKLDYDDPALYKELFDIEREAMEIYPLDYEEDNLVRAELYTNLGMLKAQPANDFIGHVAHYSHPEIPGAKYILIGELCRYPCNSLQYYTLATEIVSRVLNPGHPIAMNFSNNAVCFRLNYLVPDEQCLKDWKLIKNYVRSYFHFYSFEYAYNIIINYTQNIKMGFDDTDGLFLDSALKTYGQYIGTDHPNYLMTLSTVAALSKWTDPYSNEEMEAYRDALLSSNLDNLRERLDLFYLQIYPSVYLDIPEESRKVIDEVRQRYENGHSASIRSVNIGTLLANFYSAQLQDYKSGRQLHKIVYDDAAKLARQTNEEAYKLLYWNLKIDLTSVSVLADNAITDKGFGVLIEELEKETFPNSKIVRNIVALQWADSKSLIHDYEGAIALGRACLPQCVSDNVYINTVGTMAVQSQHCDTPPDDIVQLVDEALARLDRNVKQSNTGMINYDSLDNIADYLAGEGRYDDALNVVSQQIEIFEKRYLNLHNAEYIRLKQSQASIYRQAGRLNDASRISDEVERVMYETFGNVPSRDLLNCLWQDYYNCNPHNISNLWESTLKLNKIFDITNQLLAASGRDDGIIYTHLAAMVGECLQCWSPMINDIRTEASNAREEDYGDENVAAMREISGKLLDTLLQLATAGEELMAGFKSKYTDFLSNIYYNCVATGMAAFYGCIQQDYPKALAIREELLQGITSPSYLLTSTIGIAWDYLYVNDTAKATEYADRAADLIKCMSNLKSDDLLCYDNLRFQIASAQNNPEAALPYARSLYARKKEILDGNFQLMTETEQNKFLQSYGEPAFEICNLLEFYPDELAAETYNAAIYRTGMQLRSQRATRIAIAKSADQRVKELLDSLSILYTAIDETDLSPNFTNSQEYTTRMGRYKSLKGRANRIERRLLDATIHLRDNEIADVTWDNIASRLEVDEAAVEFILSANRVMALIIRKGFPAPVAISLMPHEELLVLIDKPSYKGSAARAKALYTSDDTLYKELWEPLETVLEGAKIVYYSTQGYLSSLAFNAFATTDGKTLFDRFDLVQLTTTAQLAFDHEQSKPITLAMMGDILYAPGQQPISLGSASIREIDSDFTTDFDDENEELSDERALSKSQFRHLPYSAVEVEGIAQLFKPEDVTLVRRHEATETELRHIVESRPDIIHLATHGYYVASTPRLLNHPFFKNVGIGSMQRSGIALADAEIAWKGLTNAEQAADGIVTAAEVGELDLSDTQLVALSACETALGDTSFEGVFGLQRGFKQAGVKSLLVSLWSVSDNSTSLFMTTFYNSLLSGNRRQQAWRNAVEKVRESYPEPFYWAPFILIDGI